MSDKTIADLIGQLEAAAGSDWQPIETAPVGRTILLWWTPKTPNKDAETVVIGSVSTHEMQRWRSSQSVQSGDLARITHWMPLPAPPADRP